MTKMKDFIEKLNLQPHPEGGLYRRNWQSGFMADVQDNKGIITHPKRALGSSILYLLQGNEVCAWHRISCEEMWHYYSGSPLKMHILTHQNGWETLILGNDILKGEQPQIVMAPKTWFSAELADPEAYSFCGCTLWPAFTYSDFELAEKKGLIEEFPQYAERLSAWFKTEK